MENKPNIYSYAPCNECPKVSYCAANKLICKECLDLREDNEE